MNKALCASLAQFLSLKEEERFFAQTLLCGDSQGMRKLTPGMSPRRLASLTKEGMCFLLEKYRLGFLPFCQLTAAAQAAIPLAGPSPHDPPAVCIGSLAGDPSAAGKNFMKMLLCAVGVPVLDLGVEVEPGAFVDAIERHHLRCAVCSVFVPALVDKVAAVDLLARERGLRARFRLAAGGAAINAEALAATGVDCQETDTALVALKVMTWLRQPLS